MNPTKKKPRFNIIKIVLYILSAGLIVGALLFYQSVIWMVLGAVIFSYLLRPAVEFLERLHIVRWLAILIIYLLIGGLLALGLVIIVPMFIDQIEDIGSKVSQIAEETSSLEEFKITEVKLVNKVLEPVIKFSEKTSLFDVDEEFRKLLYGLKNVLLSLPRNISIFAGKVFDILTFLFMVPTIGFFFLHDHEKFRRVFYKMIPNRYFELTVIIVEKTDSVLKTFFRAMMLEMLIVAVMSSISLMIVRVPYSIVIGLIAGIANVIPYLGPWIGILAAVISILLSGSNLGLIISAIIALQVVQILENRIVYPIVMGKSMDMHPLVILLTVLAGGYTFGLMGMLLSVPIVFLVKEILLILFKNLKKFEII